MAHPLDGFGPGLSAVILLLVPPTGAPWCNALATPPPPPNVLLVAVDDLRPEIGTYHPWSPHDTIITPHLDALVNKGTLFASAVVQIALCAPSRTSFLTSLRPDTTKIWTIGPFFRNTTARGATAVTLPQAFKNAGYHTESFGKVFHISEGCYRVPVVTGSGACLNDPDSWSLPPWIPSPYEERGPNSTNTGPMGSMNLDDLSWKAVDDEDEAFPDGNISVHAAAALARIKTDVVDAGGSFFLGVGFLKPHLPQVFPKKYLDLYANVTAPEVASNPFPPKGSPTVAWGGVMQEISEYSNIQAAKGDNKTAGSYNLPLAVQVAQKRAYHAATTYIDAQIGRVFQELVALGLRESTIIVVIGDHGWKLGEHGGWAKKTNFWNDARGLLIVSDPRQSDPGQVVAHTAVEYLDLYPTLADLALPTGVPPGLEGTSFAPVLHNASFQHRKVGLYQYTCAGIKACMGYSIISLPLQLRYTEWVAFDFTTATPNFNVSVAVAELYDHEKDLEENVNVAGLAAYASARSTLSAALRASFG